MRLRPTLFAAIILAACLAPATAQTSLTLTNRLQPCGLAYGTVCGGFAHATLGQTPAPSPAQNLTVPPHDSRTQLPTLAQPAAQPSTQQGASLVQPGPAIIQLAPGIIARNNSTCYAMRSYNFSKDPAADISKPVSYTTCESARDTRLKSAAASAVLVR
jgi:hypothetical protein